MIIFKKTFLIFIYPFLVFLLAVLPINNKDDLINQIYILNIRLDHIIHFLIFFNWMILISLFSIKKTPGSIKFQIVRWFFWGLLLALSSEGIQYFLNYRSFTFIDLLSNISGLLMGWLFFFVFSTIFNLFKV